MIDMYDGLVLGPKYPLARMNRAMPLVLPGIDYEHLVNSNSHMSFTAVHILRDFCEEEPHMRVEV